MTRGANPRARLASWLMPARRRNLSWAVLLVLVVPGTWVGNEMRTTARLQAEQQLAVEVGLMAAAVEYGDLPWLNQILERDSPGFSGRDRRVATGAGRIFGRFGTAGDRAALERVPLDTPTRISLSTGAVCVLRKSANSFPAMADQGYGDVTFTVARASPSGMEVAADTTILTALFGLLAVAFVALGLHAWYAVQYRQRLSAVNDHLGAVGRGIFDPLELDGSIPEEIDTLTRNVNMMIGELRRQFHSLQSFVAIAAHELRTPLTRMWLTIERMRENPSDGRADDLDRIHASSAGLLGLLEGLLELGKYQIERFDTTRFDRLCLSDAVEQTCDDFAESFEANAMRVDHAIATGIVVDAEDVLVRRMLGNLLENARKYGATDAPVRVILAQHGTRFRLAVESGGGFPDDIRDTAFVLGRRSSGVSDKPGLGLGLALVDIVAKKHGWAVMLGDDADTARVEITGTVHLTRDTARTDGDRERGADAAGAVDMQ